MLSQFPLTFFQIHKEMPCFIVLLMTILKMIRTVFMNISEMLHRRISLKSKFLLLVVNFMSGFRLAMMHISLIVTIRSSLTHLRAAAIVYKNHSFHLDKQIKSSECKVKQSSPSLPRNLTLDTFGELPVLFSTKINLQ